MTVDVIPIGAREHAEDVTPPAREHLKIVVVGHVDHGKSTLIGRLLHDTDSLPTGKIEELRRVSERRGMPLEWSFVLDSFQAERDQAVTIDTTRIWLRTPGRDTVIIDAPGHREFLKNMISGAASADAAVLVVDAIEGLREQTRRHVYLLKLLGIRQVVAVINKIDMADQAESAFLTVSESLIRYVEQLELPLAAVIPVSARHGDNLVAPSSRTPWYGGPTLVKALSTLSPPRPAGNRPLRLLVQDIYKFDERRIVVGKVTSGRLSVGDRLVFSPTDSTAVVKRIESFPDTGRLSAQAEETVGFTLEEQVFVERGHVASTADALPVLSDVFRARLFWLGRKPLAAGDELKLKIGHAECRATVREIESVLDLDRLEPETAKVVARNDIATVVLRTQKLLPLDNGRHDPALGRFVLVDGFETVAGGIVDLEGFPDQRKARIAPSTNIKPVGHLVDRQRREERNGHRGAVFWLTGLSGAGKSTLAAEVEKRLFERGYQTYMLDGDNLRHGLNADLGFSPDNRVENIRRAGEVSALLAGAGTVVLSAFISPYEADRARARGACGERFHEVYVQASIETCEKRDTKGLYKRARAGEVKDFTGVSAPYETPVSPQLVLDTEAEDIETSVTRLVDYIVEACRL